MKQKMTYQIDMVRNVVLCKFQSSRRLCL